MWDCSRRGGFYEWFFAHGLDPINFFLERPGLPARGALEPAFCRPRAGGGRAQGEPDSGQLLQRARAVLFARDHAHLADRLRRGEEASQPVAFFEEARRAGDVLKKQHVASRRQLLPVKTEIAHVRSSLQKNLNLFAKDGRVTPLFSLFTGGAPGDLKSGFVPFFFGAKFIYGSSSLSFI